jgi:hypothetical protein
MRIDIECTDRWYYYTIFRPRQKAKPSIPFPSEIPRLAESVEHSGDRYMVHNRRMHLAKKGEGGGGDFQHIVNLCVRQGPHHSARASATDEMEFTVNIPDLVASQAGGAEKCDDVSASILELSWPAMRTVWVVVSSRLTMTSVPLGRQRYWRPSGPLKIRAP